ncbi:MAG: succinyldiaminopimelate aminotransferase [candidate division GAL15 bacterium]
MSWTSHRARAIPQSVFLLMDRAKQEARGSGLEVIDLSLGSSDLSPPQPALETLAEALLDRATYQYTLRSATRPFLEAASGWYEHRYGVTFDPDTEMLSLVGSQEGIGHLLLALTDPGDLVLIPEVAYPPYWGMAALAGLEVFAVPLREDHLLDLEAVPEEVWRRARVLILNYPNNPTAAVADPGFFAQALDYCGRYEVFLIHDNPYVDMVFDGPAPSPLSLPGARERCVEFFTLSKSYHMGGFRLAFAVGNAEAIGALEAVKSTLDFNQYQGVLRMGITALRQPETWVREQVAVFQERRNALVRGLRTVGWDVPLPRATMYLWARVPVEVDDVTFAVELCRRTGVAVSPGQAFGPGGRGYVRIALVQPPERLEEAAPRIGDFLRRFRG